MTTELRPIELSDHDGLVEAFHLETSVTRENRGEGWTALPVEVRLQRWTNQPGWTFALLGAWDGDDLVGLGQRCAWEKEPDDHFIDVAVAASHRRQGIGSRLVEALETGAGPTANRFVSKPFLSDEERATELANGFCARQGYDLGTVEILQEADLTEGDIPEVALADGWQVTSHVDGIPDELLPEVGVIQGLVDEEAPSGDVEWHAHSVTPEEYREDLESTLTEGAHLVEAVALAPDGRVAGWSGLTTPVAEGRPAQVVATLVLDEFRGHGLGMALKSAVARRAVGLGVTRVCTESDQANRWMLDINRRQGFRPVGVRACFQKIVQHQDWS